MHRAIERGAGGLERVVALKRLLPHLTADEGFVRAFVGEAKLASLLQHANIVQLYELGRVETSYFISMEYVPGRDLRAILRQARRVSGPPPVQIALALMTELFDALDCAHSLSTADGRPLGFVHGDVSPSNLIVSHAGHLKVVDFGIARALGHVAGHAGRLQGKLSYMAPETVSGQSLDSRSDLFSASVIAYELLTAAPLFAARDDFDTMERVQTMKPLPPSARNPTCPPELDQIVLRGLAKEPGQRWRSAADVRAALAELAIAHHWTVTGREVCEWTEDAFEMAGRPRLRLPLAPPPGDPPPERSRPSSVRDTEDSIMDRVWGATAPRPPMAVVMDDAPDASGRYSPVAVWRAGSVSQAPPPTISSPGTAVPQRPSSLVPLMLASVAVAAAGAAIAWFVSSGRREDSIRVAADSPPAAQAEAQSAPLPVEAPPPVVTKPSPPPPAVAPSPPEVAERAADPAPKDEEDVGKDEEDVGDDADAARDRGRGSRTRKARPRREPPSSRVARAHER